MEKRTSCQACGGNSDGGGLIANTFRRWFGKNRKKSDRFEYISVSRIDANPCQPREYFLDEPHQNLKASVKEYGVIVPIIVARKRGGRFTLVAGQRRLAAARDLSFENVPAIVRSLRPKEMMEISYLENLHRENMSQIDTLLMFDRIQKRHPKITAESLAETMGLKAEDLERSRFLLDLPIPAREALRAGMITEEHSVIVSEIDDPDAMLEVIEMVYNDQLSVEDTREITDRILQKEPPFVASQDGVHFHSNDCPYSKLIPSDRMVKFYSKKEVAKKGKIACMQCL
jgi:ParB family chromosome partitioning protein